MCTWFVEQIIKVLSQDRVNVVVEQVKFQDFPRTGFTSVSRRSWIRNLSPEMKQCERLVVRETTTTGVWDCETVTKPKDNSSPKQIGAAGKTRNTQMLEDVEEPMPTERYQTNAESAISPLEETDILSLSRDEEMEVLRSLSSWNDYVMDDAELLKDLIGLDKPPLFEDDADDNFFPVSEDDSIHLRHMDDVVESRQVSPTQSHQRNGQSGEPAHRDTGDSVH